ncbi:hypothetical protein [Clostridium algidicarnis]|uniref:hypothetical protein n=1 Tax=Clostridium algidicarnis TaxID=37659 RepID=UPI001C0E34CD|nr:hypothetical protein [Clostridium algidicarnis]MBU3204097.1 hypothetical protein [Clostridium algidicarnis]MBU3212251.1 hypothetical protein [Clostridium algidicarnis]MBU3221244.1 hypothetical protein [Clostridium algidicarnis]
MIVLVLGAYILICSSELMYLYNNKLKKEAIVYISILSISVMINILTSFKVNMQPMKYFGKLLSLIKSLLGGFL